MSESLAIQYAALPYRRTHERNLEIMLITSRDSGRWVIPKGWPITKLAPADAAAREAYEEAGLVGRIGDQPIGRYNYDKRLDDGSNVHCTVDVFAFEVEKQRKSWPERDERRTRWFMTEEAVVAVEEPELRAIIRSLKKKPRVAEIGPFRIVNQGLQLPWPAMVPIRRHEPDFRNPYGVRRIRQRARPICQCSWSGIMDVVQASKNSGE